MMNVFNHQVLYVAVIIALTLKCDKYEQFLHVHIIYESLKTFIYKYQTNWDLFVF